jgi:hypothetical protein
MTGNKKLFRIVLAIVLIFALAFGFSACGKKEDPGTVNVPVTVDTSSEAVGGSTDTSAWASGGETAFGLDESTRIYTFGRDIGGGVDVTCSLKFPENWHLAVDDNHGYILIANNEGGDKYQSMQVHLLDENSAVEYFTSRNYEYAEATIGDNHYITDLDFVDDDDELCYVMESEGGGIVRLTLFKEQIARGPEDITAILESVKLVSKAR